MTNTPFPNQKRVSIPSRPLAAESLWKRFSASHQLAYAYADQQASQEGAAEITPEHLLRGMLRLSLEQSNGVRLIEELGVTPEQVDARLPQANTAVVWPPQPVAGGQNDSSRSLSSDAQAVARDSRSSADAMGHDQIGTEHLLIALLASTDAAITQALIPCGVTQTVCRERLGAWLVNGTYQREPTGAVVQTQPAGVSQLMQTVFVVRRWASIIYMLWVLGIWIARLVVPGQFSFWLGILYGVTVYPLLYFIVPYILSTYALNYLLRNRFSQGLNAMPPGRSMKGLVLPFSICAVLGVAMIAGLIPYVAALFGLSVAGISFIGLPMIVVGLQWAFLVNCVALIATHWLLTLNVR